MSSNEEKVLFEDFTRQMDMFIKLAMGIIVMCKLSLIFCVSIATVCPMQHGSME